MSVFDRLQRQLDIQKREHGISPLEIADLPQNLRKIMRLMLREVAIKYTDLRKAVEAMPVAQQLSPAELDQALATLVEQNWLVRSGEGDMLTYRVNLRRKSGSSLDKDIWASLENKITPASSSTEDAGNPSEVKPGD
ncbi:MAG: hypothetical protein JW726_00280 [Anaerolineales bacterium]|nr:hypothetical protein [Anaerolineales bacterium]